MKTDKVLAEICKAFLKPDEKIYLGHISEETIAVTMDKFACYFLHTSEFPFDVKTLLGERSETEFKRIIPEKTSRVEMTGEILLKDKAKLRRLTDGKTDVWVDERLFKNFDKSATFAISGRYSPVLVYEDERMVGMVLPHKL